MTLLSHTSGLLLCNSVLFHLTIYLINLTKWNSRVLLHDQLKLPQYCLVLLQAIMAMRSACQVLNLYISLYETEMNPKYKPKGPQRPAKASTGFAVG